MWCCAPVSGLGAAAWATDRARSGGWSAAGTADLADSAGLGIGSSSRHGPRTSLSGAGAPGGPLPWYQHARPHRIGDKHAPKGEKPPLLLTEKPHPPPRAPP